MENEKQNNSGMSGGVYHGRGNNPTFIWTADNTPVLSVNLGKKMKKMKKTEISHYIDELNAPPKDLTSAIIQYPSAGRLRSQKSNPGGLDYSDLTDADGDRRRSPVAYSVGFVSEAVCHYYDQGFSVTAFLREVAVVKGTVFQETMLSPIHIDPSRFNELIKEFIEDGFRVMNGTLVLLDELNRITAVIDPMDDRQGSPLCVASCLTGKVTEILKRLEKYITIPKQSIEMTFVTGVGQRGLETRTETLEPEETPTATPVFYPWMKGMTPAEYMMEFMESDANVCLFLGPPGTGKSTFISTVCMALGLNPLVVQDSAIASDPQFISKLGEAIVANGDKYDLLIVEDGDEMIRPRAEGNKGLNSLLTSTSGLGNKNKFKLLVTTNASDTGKVDPALLRPGRCFDIMEFGLLAPAECNAVRASIGRPKHTFRKPVVLAQALNPDVNTQKSANDDTISIVSPRFPVKHRAQSVS